MERSTIAAIATPAGRGGIGIVKISGPAAIKIASAVFSPSGSLSDSDRPASRFDSFCAGKKPPSHSLFHGHIIDPKTRHVLDEVLLGVMKAPNTYTREDVVEINAHAGGVILSAVLELVLQNGARMARPGEFTQRAYLNGRIDLAQAEAVIDLINARTEKELLIASRHLDGDMGKAVETLRRQLRDILVEIEAVIDFPEEMGDGFDFKKEKDILQKEVINNINDLIDRYRRAQVYREGLRIVIIGKPNVGKSSLMNRLLQRDRVIVTAVPGTTRDSIEETINLHGIPVILTDTAGLHDTEDPIELLGIKKVHEYIEKAEMLLFVVDLSETLTKQDRDIYRKIKRKEIILVQNKADLVPADFDMDMPQSWKFGHKIRTSALYNQGLDQLRNAIEKNGLREEKIDLSDQIIPNLRQRQALEKSLSAAMSAHKGFDAQLSPELVAIEIKEALNVLGEISGTTASDEILDQIFSRFCVGK